MFCVCLYLGGNPILRNVDILDILAFLNLSNNDMLAMRIQNKIFVVSIEWVVVVVY